jgi:hypothetical protein
MEKLDTKILDKLFKEVVNIAKEDNIITSEEQAILEKTRINIEEFKRLYEEAIEDNVITDEEFEALSGAYKKIYSDSEEEAMKDQKLTKDEVKIISKIAHTLFTP